MSLFGDDETLTPSRNQKSNLFEEPASTKSRGSSLFADDAAAAWSMPTPKKAARANLVKNLLNNVEVPDSYIDTYDALLASDGAGGGSIGIAGARRLIDSTSLDSGAKEKILGIVNPESKPEVGRGEFNVLLALIGLAQEGDEVTLDGVDERRKSMHCPFHNSDPYIHPNVSTDLPTPKLGSFTTTKKSQAAPPMPTVQKSTNNTSTSTAPKSDSHAATPSKPRTTRQPSFGNTLDSDPWGSPDLHRGHNHTTPQINGTSHPSAMRTTSTFTTSGNRQASSSPDQTRTHSYTGAGWGVPSNSGDSFRDSGLGGVSDTGGFGSSSSNPGGDDDPTGLGRAIPVPRVAGTTAPDEVITITALPEKEGMMFFQHRNYEVSSSRRGTKVVRRYSDFVWLLDCLHKRYPYRQLPLLPPKRVAINGNHIAAEANFLEKRRRGLSRFSNALVRHPVLAQEQLVVMFLTVPTELAVWRKQAAITVVDEFAGKPLPPSLEDGLPGDLEETFVRVRSGVRRSAEVYINLCNLVERLGRRSEGVAAEYMRVSNTLFALAEASADTFAIDTNDVPLMNAGLGGTAKHLDNAKALLEDEARTIDEGVLEDLKRVRDRLVSIRDVFDRRERLERDEIPRLEKRIHANEEKLKTLRSRPEGTLKPGEAEKVEDAILRVCFPIPPFY